MRSRPAGRLPGDGSARTFPSGAVAASVDIVGEIAARMVVMMRRTSLHLILTYLTGVPTPRSGKLDFTSDYALRQLANSLTTSFCDNVYKFLHAKARYAMPEIWTESWTSILRRSFVTAGRQVPALLAIQAEFYDEQRTFDGMFIFLVSTTVQTVIEKKIRQLLDEA